MRTSRRMDFPLVSKPCHFGMTGTDRRSQHCCWMERQGGGMVLTSTDDFVRVHMCRGVNDSKVVTTPGG